MDSVKSPSLYNETGKSATFLGRGRKKSPFRSDSFVKFIHHVKEICPPAAKSVDKAKSL